MPDHRTTEALDELKSYTTNEANEPPSFSLNRLTGDLFTNSFLGGRSPHQPVRRRPQERGLSRMGA